MRTASLLGELRARVEIELWAVAEPSAPDGQREGLETLAARVRLFERGDPTVAQRLARARPERWFHSRALRAALAGVDRLGFDLVHLDEPCLAGALPRELRTPVLVHHHKLDREYARATRAPVWERAKLARLEREVARRTPDHVTCSAEDALRLARRRPGLRVTAVECGVDPAAFSPLPGPREPDRLLFLGSLAYEPNLDGLEWFVEQVLPLVRRARGLARLRVVGERAGRRARALVRPGVELVGEVEDAREELARAALSVVPLRIGGGTRLKIPISLASRCPVVSTRVGAEGLGLAPGVHLLLADEPETFARSSLLLLERPGLAGGLARAGAEHVARELAWPRLAGRLLDSWEGARRYAGSSPKILA